MAADNDDWLGGYTLQQLLGSSPVLSDEKKPSVVAKILGAPFRAIAMLIKLPVIAVGRLLGGLGNAAVEIVKLPARLASAIFQPWKKKN